MTLTNKIIILISFIFLSSVIVLYWFTQRLFEHMEGFKYSMAVEKQSMKARFAEKVEDLQSKREQLSQEISTHLNHMESELTKNQERADEFDKEFLEGQNTVFDAIEDFNAGKERNKPKLGRYTR